jgi:epoxyqueuosine reductase
MTLYITKEPPQGLWEQISQLALSGGAFRVGCADIRSLQDLQVGDPTTLDYPSAVSFAVEIPPAAANASMKAPSEEMREAYKQCNKKLKQIGAQVVESLSSAGFQARFVDPAERIVPEKLLGPISHKAVAHQSGIGWIGKNGLLITDEHGPRFRMGTVLTNMAIVEKPVLLDCQCGECTLCIDECPTNSLKATTGFKDHPQDREQVIDWGKCGKYEKALIGDGSRPEKACGRCISVCPRSNLG